MLASPDDDDLRHSVLGLAVSTAVAVALLAAASLFDGVAQGALWALAIFLDMAGPYFFGSEGWKLVPGHFAERHGLIVIIALGESIVAIGVGAAGALDLGIGAAAVLGVGARGGAVVDLLRRRRPDLGPAARRSRGRPGAERARPRLLLLHPPADGRRDRPRRLRPEDGDRPRPTSTCTTVPAFALLGGVALYLLGLVAFRYRHVHTLNRQRLGLAIVLLILVPVATAIPALVALAIVVVLIWAMIAYEHRSYGERRDQLRHEAAVSH